MDDVGFRNLCFAALRVLCLRLRRNEKSPITYDWIFALYVFT